jgi:hypothetical protein
MTYCHVSAASLGILFVETKAMRQPCKDFRILFLGTNPNPTLLVFLEAN